MARSFGSEGSLIIFVRRKYFGKRTDETGLSGGRDGCGLLVGRYDVLHCHNGKAISPGVGDLLVVAVSKLTKVAILAACWKSICPQVQEAGLVGCSRS